MINASFVFGMDEDDASVCQRTVEWAVAQGIETATFHILPPYPGTALYDRMAAAARIVNQDWNCYDTRHVVYQPARMTPKPLETGYWDAYRQFYTWPAIFRSAWAQQGLTERLRHLAYV